jgi:hypothetical protein
VGELFRLLRSDYVWAGMLGTGAGYSTVREEVNLGMDERGYLEDWEGVPRSQLFESVIRVVDATRHRAVDDGDYRYVTFIDEVIFPFLESEQRKAEEEEK